MHQRTNALTVASGVVVHVERIIGGAQPQVHVPRVLLAEHAGLHRQNAVAILRDREAFHGEVLFLCNLRVGRADRCCNGTQAQASGGCSCVAGTTATPCQYTKHHRDAYQIQRRTIAAGRRATTTRHPNAVLEAVAVIVVVGCIADAVAVSIRAIIRRAERAGAAIVAGVSVVVRTYHRIVVIAVRVVGGAVVVVVWVAIVTFAVAIIVGAVVADAASRAVRASERAVIAGISVDVATDVGVGRVAVDRIGYAITVGVVVAGITAAVAITVGAIVVDIAA